MNPYYKDYSEYIGEIFPGRKIQKISVNAGFSCPNRDGTISRGGCIYCLNPSFTPGYCLEGERSVSAQLQEGKRFFSRKYPSMEYLAYFQSFTNTFGSVDRLESLYREAMECDGVVGVVVGTRPDCIDSETARMLARLNREKPLFVELGAESSSDETLRLINRGHTWENVERTAEMLSGLGLRVGLHLIAGLPGEEEEEVLENVSRSLALPIDSLKMHQLQVLKGTELARRIAEEGLEVVDFGVDRYLELCCRIVGMTPRHVCLERFLSSAPPGMVLSPKWGLKNHEFTNLLLNALKKRNRNQQPVAEGSDKDNQQPVAENFEK